MHEANWTCTACDDLLRILLIEAALGILATIVLKDSFASFGSVYSSNRLLVPLDSIGSICIGPGNVRPGGVCTNGRIKALCICSWFL